MNLKGFVAYVIVGGTRYYASSGKPLRSTSDWRDAWIFSTWENAKTEGDRLLQEACIVEPIVVKIG